MSGNVSSLIFQARKPAFGRKVQAAIALTALLFSGHHAQAEQPVSPVIAIAAGGTSFLRADGSVWAFTDPGRLTRPVKVPSLTDIVQIAGSDGSTGYALRRDGSVWSWTARCRSPDEDQTVCRYEQIRQIKGLADVIQIAAGRAFAIALRRDGTVWGWGDDTVGQLGDTAEMLKIGLGQRDALEKEHPVVVPTPQQIPILKDIVQVSANLDHAIALDNTGQAWTWGCNASDLSTVGTLGEGEFVSQSGVGIIKLTTLPSLSEIAGGSSRLAVIDRNGNLWAWGVYRDGVVQYGSMKAEKVPDAKKPRHVVANHGAVFWIDNDGTAWQQGPGMFGYDKDTPGRTVKVDLDSPVAEISPGDFKVSALTEKGQIWTWGNGFGYAVDPTLVLEH